MQATLETDVVVVGAGPTGLMLALCLARLGVRVEVVDGKAGPTIESRALVLQARSMELYDQLGIADRVLAESAFVTTVAPGFGRTAFGRVDLASAATGVTPFARVTVFEQSRNERLLVDELAAAGVRVRWEHAVETIHDRRSGGIGSGVDVQCATGDGKSLHLAARYCVGTDGSSSRVRELLGVPFEGATSPHTFYVLDAIGVRGLAHDAVSVRFADHDLLLGFPMGSVDHERLIGIVRTPDDRQVAEAEVRGTLTRIFGVGYEASRWFSTYRVHHRVAARFRVGDVFLAGDAAHVHSPVGAQGMNTGLQDAHNLACKLADVIAGRADDASLERYEAERRPVARRLVATTDAIFGVVTSERAAARAVKRRLLPLIGPVAAFAVPRLGTSTRIFEYLSQIRIHVWMSDAARRNARGSRGRVVGRRLPYNGDNFESLRSFAWQVHAYGDSAREVATALGLPFADFPVPRHPLLRHDLLYLVRPDGFVAAAATRDAAAAAFALALPRAGRSALSHADPG